MRAVWVALALGTLACASPPDPLLGAWQSNRELTLAELEPLPTISEEQWELLAAPDFFGELVQVHMDGMAVSVLAGRCMPPSSGTEVVDSGPGFVTYRHWDYLLQEYVTLTARVDGDLLYVPVPALGEGAREVFSRRPLEDVLDEFPCIGELVDGR